MPVDGLRRAAWIHVGGEAAHFGLRDLAQTSGSEALVEWPNEAGLSAPFEVEDDSFGEEAGAALAPDETVENLRLSLGEDGLCVRLRMSSRALGR